MSEVVKELAPAKYKGFNIRIYATGFGYGTEIFNSAGVEVHSLNGCNRLDGVRLAKIYIKDNLVVA